MGRYLELTSIDLQTAKIVTITVQGINDYYILIQLTLIILVI